MAQDWTIQSRSHQCTACEKPFDDAQACISALFRSEIGFERGDFCIDCWEPYIQQHPPYSSWKSIYHKPAPPEDHEPLKKETAESLLRKRMELEDEADIPVIYILAVMLERKKMLVEKDVTVDEDDTVQRIYEHRKTGETFVITDPRLDIDKLEDVQQKVAELLGQGSQPSQPDSPTVNAPDAEPQPQEPENHTQEETTVASD